MRNINKLNIRTREIDEMAGAKILNSIIYYLKFIIQLLFRHCLALTVSYLQPEHQNMKPIC